MCEGAVQLAWDAITDATTYDVYQLVGDSMQVIGNTASLSYLITGLDKTKTYWFGTAAKNNGIAGRRSLSVSMNPTTGDCSLAAFNNDLKVDAIVEPTTARQLFSNASNATKPVKISIKNTIDALAGYRMGLAVFSADAVLQCPLTTDRSLLFDIFVRSLNTQMLSSGGTNIASALDLIAEKFKKQDALNALNKRRNSTKILVLFTDGEDFGENYRKATRLLSDLGVRLFVVGVGTPEGGNMPTANGSLKKNSNGEVIVTHLNSAELRTIAREAGGKYFEISTEINNMPQLISDIDNTKGSLQMNMEVFVSANKYFYFLWAAFAMLVLDVLITIRTIKI